MIELSPLTGTFRSDRKRLLKQAVLELDALRALSSTAAGMSSLDDLQWVRIEGLTPQVTEDDIAAYFQTARCGSGLVKSLLYLGQQKTAAAIGIDGMDTNGW